MRKSKTSLLDRNASRPYGHSRWPQLPWSYNGGRYRMAMHRNDVEDAATRLETLYAYGDISDPHRRSLLLAAVDLEKLNAGCGFIEGYGLPAICSTLSSLEIAYGLVGVR